MFLELVCFLSFFSYPILIASAINEYLQRNCVVEWNDQVPLTPDFEDQLPAYLLNFVSTIDEDGMHASTKTLDLQVIVAELCPDALKRVDVMTEVSAAASTAKPQAYAAPNMMYCLLC
jgi:hypothetical protein